MRVPRNRSRCGLTRTRSTGSRAIPATLPASTRRSWSRSKASADRLPPGSANTSIPGPSSSSTSFGSSTPLHWSNCSRSPVSDPRPSRPCAAELNIQNLDDLKSAIEREALRDLPGLGKTTEEKIAKSIDRLGHARQGSTHSDRRCAAPGRRSGRRTGGGARSRGRQLVREPAPFCRNDRRHRSGGFGFGRRRGHESRRRPPVGQRGRRVRDDQDIDI